MIYKSYRKGDQLLEISQDLDPIDPRSWDNLGSMVCYHSRYNLGDSDHGIDRSGLLDYMKNHKIKSCLNLYLYDHSGLTINTSGFSCPWDSGQIGYIWATDQDIRENWGIKRISSKRREQVLRILESEVETYDQYLRGDTYGFNLYKIETCNLGHEHKINLNSCWGFYGDNFKENGLLCYAEIDDLRLWTEL